jgi:hypothetical protein
MMTGNILDRRMRSVIIVSCAIFTGALFAALVYSLVALVFLWVSLFRGPGFF